MVKTSEDKVAEINTAVNVLGLLWNTKKDALSLIPKPIQSLDTTAATKWTMLQELSKILICIDTSDHCW